MLSCEGVSNYLSNNLQNVIGLGMAILIGPLDLALKVGATVSGTFTRGCCAQPEIDKAMQGFFLNCGIQMIPVQIYGFALGLISGDIGKKAKPLLVLPAVNVIATFAQSLSLSKNFLKKEIAARFAWLLGGLAMTALKVLELAIGFFCVALSFCFLGRWTELNTRAASSLMALDFIETLLTFLSLSINPSLKDR